MNKFFSRFAIFSSIAALWVLPLYLMVKTHVAECLWTYPFIIAVSLSLILEAVENQGSGNTEGLTSDRTFGGPGKGV